MMKKLTAFLLCICLLVSMFSFTSSAVGGILTVEDVKALKVNESDPEIIYQMEMRLDFPRVGDDEKYSKLHTEIDLPITYSNNPFDDTPIAFLRIISYENGIIKADVYSTDGEYGARIFYLTGANVTVLGCWDICFPDNFFENPRTGEFYMDWSCTIYEIENATYRDVFPKSLQNIITAVKEANFANAALRTAPFILFVPIVVPIYFMSIVHNCKREIKSVYDGRISNFFLYQAVFGMLMNIEI